MIECVEYKVRISKGCRNEKQFQAIHISTQQRQSLCRARSRRKVKQDKTSPSLFNNHSEVQFHTQQLKQQHPQAPPSYSYTSQP